MRYVPTVNDDSLKDGLTVSTGLHFLMFLFLYFGLPRIIPPLPAHHGPIPFDIVTLAEITNTRIGNDEQQKAAPAAAPVPEAAKPQPPAPSPAKTEPEAAVEALIPKPVGKPKPPVEKPAAPQQQQDLLGSVLKNVAKLKPTERTTGTDQKAEAGATGVGFGPSFSSRLTITEEDALRRQIEQCWNPPVGARDAQSLIVEVTIDVNPDRTVANAEVVDKMRYASDPFFRAAADAAMRAVRNPKCSPLELAVDKYQQWKRIDFTFDPRDML
jgi:outer membrane biosynthesis protein TonB